MKTTSPILLIEDDPVVLDQMAGALEDEGYETVRARSAEEGSDRLKETVFSVVITDLRLPGAGGLAVVENVRALTPDTPVLVVTAHASVDSAVEAMRCGAFHYLQKPITVDTLLVQLEKALEHGKALRERAALKARLSAERGLGNLLGESPAMTFLRETIQNVALTDSTVLVTGETGTGKELVADALHYESPRAPGPLVKVNCAALAENLLESELFGHEKGAFTGAEQRRAGKVERAEGGTLFLDEITEMGEPVQAKLLRVLQGAEFERVGGDEPLRCDVRFIAASNRDPMTAVGEGRLREDLYFRLNVVRIEIPPLRDRAGDVPFLAETFLRTCTSRFGKTVRFDASVLPALQAHAWPGNVRELEHAVERAVVLARGEVIGPSDLLPESMKPAAGAVSGEKGGLDLSEVERRTILRALDEADWNKTQASQALGIFPSSLYKKMKRLGIPKDKPK
ncbi:MAG: sigma-54-dependent transcriptional regulator [Planctomycetota bacterium]|jgi:two-component system response regulator HydG